MASSGSDRSNQHREAGDSVLARVHQPSDLQPLGQDDLTRLASEIRTFLVEHVSRTGGHLGPNLGVVELTIALHRVFDSPSEPIIFDTGHQSYVHKMLTGRRDQFDSLRQRDGLSGYPSRVESAHDWVENSHASTSLSWAWGLAKAHKLQHDPHPVVAVVGDGALTGGMTWEALNNIADDPTLPLVILVNDNGRSYTPTVGGLARHLIGLRTDRRYEQTLDVVRRTVTNTPLVGRTAYELLHGLKTGLKDVLSPQGMFSDLGLKYVGPIDGHDEAAVEEALRQARSFGGPVIVHVLTQKGKGFKAAEEHVEDQFHSVGQIDNVTGEPLRQASGRSWTEVFAQELVEIGHRRPDVVAITAAMAYPTGLNVFAEAFPDRTFDVGIAEQHAVTAAAGLASCGLHPVVALYSTFLNRAFDQVLMDVALHRQGVTFVLDRSGVTGTDGASHNGMWDVSLMGLVPGLSLIAPRDEARLREALNQAVEIGDGPSVVRYSKESLPEPIEAIRRAGGLDLLREAKDAQVLVVAMGQFAGLGCQVADALAEHGIGADVVDPLWVLPVNEHLLELANGYDLVLTLEDAMVVGGAGEHLAQALATQQPRTQRPDVVTLGIPQQFLAHASRGQVLAEIGLDVETITATVMARLQDAKPGTNA